MWSIGYRRWSIIAFIEKISIKRPVTGLVAKGSDASTIKGKSYIDIRLPGLFFIHCVAALLKYLNESNVINLFCNSLLMELKYGMSDCQVKQEFCYFH